MNKETALHNIAMCASKAFIDSNIKEYQSAQDGYSMLVSDLTDRYFEAYNLAVKSFPKTKPEFSDKPFIQS